MAQNRTDMEPSKPVLAPLQADRTASCYRLGPGSSERMAVLAPGHALRTLDRIEINRFVERQGVTYYVLEVFMKTNRSKTTRLQLPQSQQRVFGMPTEEQDESDDVLIDVELNATPDLLLERRYSEFEALRTRLSACMETLHEGECAYCDAFIAFLSNSSVQPGLYTKLTTRPPQRKQVLGTFINRTVHLAVQRVEGEVDGAPAHCDGWSIIPPIVESFLREPRLEARPGSSSTSE